MGFDLPEQLMEHGDIIYLYLPVDYNNGYDTDPDEQSSEKRHKVKSGRSPMHVCGVGLCHLPVH